MIRVPASLEQAIDGAVAHHLERELAERRLVLAAEEVAEAEADVAQLGARLLVAVVHRYDQQIGPEAPMAFEFDSEGTATRFQTALAFGAVTATVLSPVGPTGTRLSESIELLSAVFNVGIGLIDGLCDEDSAIGRKLLALVVESDLATAAEHKPARGWLRARLPPTLREDATVAFTVDIIEAFFETLHAAYPTAECLPLRRGVAVQLAEALHAERVSVGSSSSYTRERLLECSRLTSVLPFQIIEALVRPDHTGSLPTPGTLLGEAVWQIDDLVDLCQDARSGALNSLLIGVAPGPWHSDDDRTVLGALRRLLASTDLAEAAEQAAENLRVGLQRASGRLLTEDRQLETLAFLRFIQDYAGIPPLASS